MTRRALRSRLAELKLKVGAGAARIALSHPALERALVRGCRNATLRARLGLGVAAIGYHRALANKAGRTLRVAEMGAYKFYVNVAEPLGIGPYFFGRSGTAWLTPELIRRGDICIDAGANAGHYTFVMASAVGEGGRVYSFEANPEFAELVTRSAALNGFSSFVTVVQRALWNEPDQELKFYLSTEPSNSGTSSLVNHGWYLSEDRTIQVQTTTLDVFARSHQLEHLRLVKIDVERVEEQVLQGASGLLSRHAIDYLIVELVAGTDAQGVLARHGYSGYLLDLARGRLRPIGQVEAGTFGDFLFVAPALQSTVHDIALLSSGTSRPEPPAVSQDPARRRWRFLSAAPPHRTAK